MGAIRVKGLIHTRLTIPTPATAFWKNSSFPECVRQEISSVCVDTKLRTIKATCIVSGDRLRPRVSLHSQCKQQNPWQWLVNKAIKILCIHV